MAIIFFFFRIELNIYLTIENKNLLEGVVRAAVLNCIKVSRGSFIVV